MADGQSNAQIEDDATIKNENESGTAEKTSAEMGLVKSIFDGGKTKSITITANIDGDETNPDIKVKEITGVTNAVAGGTRGGKKRRKKRRSTKKKRKQKQKKRAK